MYGKRHLFGGKINDTKINDFRNLNYALNGLNERKEFVDELLKNDNDFFAIYFDDFYKDNVGVNDELSEKNVVCKTLETLASYLLGSEEVRKDRKDEKTQYKFYVDETEFILRTKRELPMTSLTKKSNDVDIEALDNVIHFLKQNMENFKKEKVLTLKNADFKRNDYCSEILNAYNVLYIFLSEEIKNPTKIKGKRQKLTKMKKEVMDDMLYCKEHLLGVFGKTLKNPISDSTKPNWDKLDYTNVEHMKKLLYVTSGFHPENELSYFLMDLKTLHKECLKRKMFSSKEIKVYNMLRQGYKNVEIAEELQVERYVITRTVNTIAKKLCKTAIDLGWKEEC